MIRKKIAIQGYPGSFHDEVCRQYFGNEIDVVPTDSFEELGNLLSTDQVDCAVMAIENSIAGTILQNYRILRERSFNIIGERYLRIKHNLLTYQPTRIQDLQEIHSHPMALKQCLTFLHDYPHIKLVESQDTALSAMKIMKSQSTRIGSISSMTAANLYELNVLAEGIETNPMNYTRFFMLENKASSTSPKANKASVYIRIPDVKGQLLKVLQSIHDHNLNMSKLQSFPVMGHLRSYFFHLDIEFETITAYEALKADIQSITEEFAELGVYTMDTIIPTSSKNTSI